MNSELARKWGPWGIIAAVVVGVGSFVVPVLTKLVWDLWSLSLGVLALGALVYCLPLFALILRNLVWKARKEVIEHMSVETLETGLQTMWNGITKMEGRIAQGKADLKTFSQLSPEDKELLADDPEASTEYDEQKKEAAHIIHDLEGERDEQVEYYNKMKRNVRLFKLKQKLGLGYQSLIGVLAAGTDGQNAQDMQTAMEAIQRQLNEAQSRVELILSRPRAVRKAKVVNITEVTDGGQDSEKKSLPPAKDKLDAYPIRESTKTPLKR